MEISTNTTAYTRRTMDDEKALAMLREAIERKLATRNSTSTDQARRQKPAE